MTHARELLGLGLEEARAALGADARPVPGDEYGRMEHVTSIEDQRVFPGTVYIKDDTVELVRVSREGLSECTTVDLRDQFGVDAVPLRSRAGKRATMWVHAEEGIAYSAQGSSIDFLEVFRPCTQREYETRIYRKPDRFIR